VAGPGRAGGPRGTRRAEAAADARPGRSVWGCAGAVERRWGCSRRRGPVGGRKVRRRAAAGRAVAARWARAAGGGRGPAACPAAVRDRVEAWVAGPGRAGGPRGTRRAGTAADARRAASVPAGTGDPAGWEERTAEPARSRPRPGSGARGEPVARRGRGRRWARSDAVRWETPDTVLGRGAEPRTTRPRRVLRHEFRVLACSESVAKPRAGPGGRNGPVGASHVRADTPPGGGNGRAVTGLPRPRAILV